VSVAAAVLLGIVQGLTEFLPVSSSAHLIIARGLFGWEVPNDFALAFDVALHLGTLSAIVIYFWRDLLAMLAALPSVLSPSAKGASRTAQLIVAGTVPLVIVGVLFNDYIEGTLRSPRVAAWALTIGAIAMFAAERVGSQRRVEDSLTWMDSILVGCAQACALVPGVSRSGSTITAGLFLGVRREDIARFTFLLAIPATLAAAAKEGLELRHIVLPPSSFQLMAIGIVVSAAVGYLTIKYFLRYLAGHRLDVFAYYRLALAAVAFIWL
jgi:undecaprenyl-diphosphatase